MRAILVLLATIHVLVVGIDAGASIAAEPPVPVGVRQVEFADDAYGSRILAMTVFYPAADTQGSPPFTMAFATGLDLYEAPPVAAGRYPLVMLSHGRGSNGMVYAWFAQLLASNGYVVAALDHYRANSYDRTIAYLANRIWQRPVDLSLVIDHLLDDPEWGRYIDPARIGVAGHSQGGFTALWLAGAKVNADRFLAFQRRWRNDKLVPKHLRDELPVDATPALAVHDPRIKAAFAMAPGIVQAFGMDEAGLAQLKVPAYVIVGAGDTVTPPEENAVFAAQHIPGAELNVLPGAVGHEIFVNECDDEGKAEFPDSCVDAPGVDRHALHELIGEAALSFFGGTLKSPSGG